MQHLAQCYRDDVENDEVEAEFWLQLAANQGCRGAQRSLGYLFLGRLGSVRLGSEFVSSRDFERAVEWFKCAAQQGDDIAKGAYRELLGVICSGRWPCSIQEMSHCLLE